MSAPSPAPIAFVGFMGAGKTLAANTVGGILEREVLDTDRLIESRAGRSIPNIFAERGEDGFRALEEEVVLEALARPGAVVALGGGAVESERIRAALAEAVTVWCRVAEADAWARCAGTDRPLARNRDGFRRRFGARLPLYEEVGRVVMPESGAPAGAAVAPWLELLGSAPGVRMEWARTPSGEYPALVGPGATTLLAGLAPEQRPGARLFGAADRAALAGAGTLLPELDGGPAIEVEGGEPAKTLRAAEALLGELARAGVRRDDALVAFGGGVVGDLAGFCAAVYQRGIPVVQVPTTLVAQVDSAYGGKTGVDLPEGKNYVGAFHQPAAVLADPAALESLPAEELAAGFAEVVKTALLAGGRLWERVRAIERLDAAAVAPLIFDCARTKLDVVAADERDTGLRAVLNLGHTVGHAIEAASGYGRYRHGEAISLGLLAALRLSGAPELRAEVAGLLARAGLPTTIDPAIGFDAVIDAVGRDKKRTAAGVGFVLLSEPGAARHGEPVQDGELEGAVRELWPR